MIGKQGATVGPGVRKHILGRLSVTVVAHVFFARCLICENAVCAPLFCPARDIVCIFFLLCWLCRLRLPDDFRESCNSPAEGCDTCQPTGVVCTSRCCSQCGQHQETPPHTTRKGIRSSGRHQLDGTGTTCCWSCWQSLNRHPHYGIPGTLSSTIVAMFLGPKLARQGVGGCRDLPQWTIRLFWKHCPRRLEVEICCDQTSSGWGPHGGNEKKSHHFVGQWSIHRQLWRWWSLCRQICGAHGDCHATAKLGGRDPLRLAQFLWSSRLCRIFGTQIMGCRRSGWNGWDFVRLWVQLCAPEGDGIIFPISQFSFCGGCTFYVETPGQDGRGPGWTPGRCWGALSPHRAF